MFKGPVQPPLLPSSSTTGEEGYKLRFSEAEETSSPKERVPAPVREHSSVVDAATYAIIACGIASVGLLLIAAILQDSAMGTVALICLGVFIVLGVALRVGARVADRARKA